jgi:hypothetical protein
VDGERDLSGREPVGQALRPDAPGHEDFLADFPGAGFRRVVAGRVAVRLGARTAIVAGHQASCAAKLSD